MALDYNTLRAMAASKPQDADGYCPECGRPWSTPVRESPRPAWRFPGSSTLLVVVGLCLAVAFGQRALGAYQTEAAIQRDLAMLSNCADSGWTGAGCPPTAKSLSVLAANRDDPAHRQRDGALVATAFGLVALVVGLGSLARRGRGRPSRSASPLPAAVWRAGECLLALVCLLLLTLYLDLVALQLSLGLPLTMATLDRAADDALTVVSIIAGA